jgi:hypothetical protein
MADPNFVDEAAASKEEKARSKNARLLLGLVEASVNRTMEEISRLKEVGGNELKKSVEKALTAANDRCCRKRLAIGDEQ